MKEHNSWGTVGAEREAPAKAGRRAKRGEFTEHKLCTRSHGRELMQVFFLNLFTLGEWSPWEELVKFREEKIFPRAMLVLKESHRESKKTAWLVCFREWKDIQLDRLGEFREGLKIICGAEYLEHEDWANSGRQWRTEEPGMSQSTRPQQVRHELVTEQQKQVDLGNNVNWKTWRHDYRRIRRCNLNSFIKE